MKPVSLLFGLALVLSAVTAHGETNPGRDFGRYQPIIDRLPFGGSAGGAGSANQPNFAGRFSLIGMVSSNFPNGQVQAILLDRTAQNKTYFRSEGEMIDGVKVVKINDELPNRSVVLQQGLETATLTYEARRAAVPRPLTPGGMPGAAGPIPVPEPEGSAAPSSASPIPSAPRRLPFRR